METTDMSHTLAPTVLLLAALAGGACFLPAQESAPRALPTFAKASPIRAGATAPDGRSAGIWASGPTYKVSFHDGMTFYPYVGSRRPHQPLHWRTVSVRAGGHELLRENTAPAPRATDWRCEYDLGPVTERYDVRDDGVEQSFVVHERPPAGELVVVGEVSSPLQLPPMAAQHGPLSLHLADGRPVIDYGAAVAIDRNGVRTPVATATDGNRILLRVAAETVAAAAFPLVIDPLLASNTLLALGLTVDDADVLHETLTPVLDQARMWYSWSAEVAAGDHDVRLWRLGADFDGTIVEQYREISLWDSKHGRLALAPAADYVVMVYETDAGSNRWIGVHRHHITDNHLTTTLAFVPQPLAGYTDWRPDVGGHLEPSGNKVLITFQRETVQPWANTASSTVYATVFDASVPNISNGFVVQPFVVLQRPNADQERPAVNQSASGNEWLLAFQELNHNVNNDDWDITTVAIDQNGVVTPSNLDTESGPDLTVHSITPEISGAHGRYLLTYTTRDFEQQNPKPTGAKGRYVFAQRLDFDHGTGIGSLPHPAVQLFASQGNQVTNVGSAFDAVSRSHWCTGLINDALGRYRVHKVGFTGNLVETAAIVPAAGLAPETFSVSFQADARRFPILWSEHDVAGASLLHGAKMDYVAVPAPTLIGFACGSGVWTGLDATADRQQVGSQGMPLRLTGAPEDSISFVMISTAQINVPADGLGAPGCTIVPDIGANLITLIPAVIQNGDSTVRVDLPEYAGSVTLYMQWGYFATGANPLGILASEGLRVVVAQ
jgi:hypothetical protein